LLPEEPPNTGFGWRETDCRCRRGVHRGRQGGAERLVPYTKPRRIIRGELYRAVEFHRDGLEERKRASQRSEKRKGERIPKTTMIHLVRDNRSLLGGRKGEERIGHGNLRPPSTGAVGVGLGSAHHAHPRPGDFSAGDSGLPKPQRTPVRSALRRDRR
jgi:hypothetical protein